MRGVAVLRCGPAAADRLPGVLTSFPVGRRHSACHVQVAGSCCQVACFTGAVVLSRNQVRCSGQEYPLAQQVGFRTSVHRRLELLDAVDGALDESLVAVSGSLWSNYLAHLAARRGFPGRSGRDDFRRLADWVEGGCAGVGAGSAGRAESAPARRGPAGGGCPTPCLHLPGRCGPADRRPRPPDRPSHLRGSHPMTTTDTATPTDGAVTSGAARGERGHWSLMALSLI